MMSPRAARTRRPTLEEPADPVTPQPADTNGDDLPIFTLLKRYTEAEWQRLYLYLYRLEPKVKNADGPAYIEKFSSAIDEDDIKNSHGGGKYQLWLKDTATDDTIRKVNVTIAGSPILQANQIVQGPAGAPAVTVAPAAPALPVVPQQDPALAAVLKLLGDTLQTIKSEKPSQETANQMLIDTMQKANSISMEMVKSQVMAPANGGITDKFLAVALERMLKQPDPVADLTRTMELMKLLRGDQPAAPGYGDALGALKSVKDALGLDVKEMLQLKADAGESSGGSALWLTPLTAAIPDLVNTVPKVFQELNQGKRIELEIQRTQLAREQVQLRAMEIHRGLPPSSQVPAPAPPPGTAAQAGAAPSIPPLDPPPATLATGAASAAPATPAANSPEAELNEMAVLVVRCFRAGKPGDMTAEIVDNVFPQVVAELEPFIVDVPTVDVVVRAHPVLAQMVNDPRYMVFLGEFVEYFTADEEEEDEPEPEPEKVTA